MTGTIPYGRHLVDDDDVQSVVNILRSDWLTQGTTVDAFEAAVADYCGANYAVAVSSGTSALYLGCRALGIKHGDSVWTTPISFVASANCVLQCGAQVDFVDIDPQTRNISVPALKTKLESAARCGDLPDAVIVVHFAGLSCDMLGIRALADQYGFSVVEDACHALGGHYQNDPVGRCRHSDLAVFSFHPVKAITTGEGGMIVTNSAAIADQSRRLRSHGITRNADEMHNQPHGPWYYEQHSLGVNARMTDIQAALGLSQLKRLDAWIGERRNLAARYEHALAELTVQCPPGSNQGDSAWHLYVVEVDEDNRRVVFEALRSAGIGVQVHYIPIHLQPYYRSHGFAAGDFPNAERYYRRCISLPLYPGLAVCDQDFVIRKFVEAAECV